MDYRYTQIQTQILQYKYTQIQTLINFGGILRLLAKTVGVIACVQIEFAKLRRCVRHKYTNTDTNTGTNTEIDSDTNSNTNADTNPNPILVGTL